MKKPVTKPTVKLIGYDGHALAITDKCERILKAAGADEEYCEQFRKKAMSGDYNNFLNIAQEYFEVT